MLKTLSYLVTVIFSILILQYAVIPRYTFPRPHPFRGDYLYNPYSEMDSTKWKMANFHAHSRLYAGLTAGAANDKEMLDRYYRQFSYDIISISNYQMIDTFENRNKWFIPVYEHGYQFYKNHQLVINARKTSWIDLPLRQTLSNKQFIIDRIKRDTSVILSIVHPIKRGAYRYRDLKYLANYDCLEIASSECTYTSYYDTILSAGHPVFLIADDDTHDIAGKNDACQSFSLINTDLEKGAILHAMKAGCMVGVKLNGDSCSSDSMKKSCIGKLPEITGIRLNGDIITVSLDRRVESIRFIGQNGIERKEVKNSKTGSYEFGQNDSYIRTEIECPDGTTIYLNPVFRYDGKHIAPVLPAPDKVKTWTSRIFVLPFIFFIPFMWNRRKAHSLYKKSKIPGLSGNLIPGPGYNQSVNDPV